MFERFTDRARRSVVLAQEEARARKLMELSEHGRVIGEGMIPKVEACLDSLRAGGADDRTAAIRQTAPAV